MDTGETHEEQLQTTTGSQAENTQGAKLQNKTENRTQKERNEHKPKHKETQEMSRNKESIIKTKILSSKSPKPRVMTDSSPNPIQLSSMVTYTSDVIKQKKHNMPPNCLCGVTQVPIHVQLETRSFTPCFKPKYHLISTYEVHSGTLFR